MMMDYTYMGQAPSRTIETLQNRVMNRFDRDGSGDISLAEAGDRGRLARNFLRIDANDDGTLSQSEIGDSIAARLDGMFGSDRGLSPMGPERMNAIAAWMQMQEANEQKVAAFDGIDTDGNGALSDGELTAEIDALRAAEAAEEMRQAKIAEMTRMDLNGDGTVSLSELQSELQMRQEAAQVAAFDSIDTDGDGMLSDAEIAEDVAAQQAAIDAQAAAMTEVETADVMEAVAAEEIAEAGPMPASNTDDIDNDEDTLSLIENVFEDMLEGRGETVTLESLAAMTQSLYSSAQEILMQQLEQAAEFVGESDAQDEDPVEYT